MGNFLMLTAAMVVGFIFFSYILYKNRNSSIVLVNFDTVIVNMEHLSKRADIYVKNNPLKSKGEYIGAHITEQELNPAGIKSILELQKNFYRIVFVTWRDESLRPETAKILNDWGFKGELYMNFNDILSERDRLADMISHKKAQNLKIVDFIGFDNRIERIIKCQL